jgi:hypothetical protein
MRLKLKSLAWHVTAWLLILPFNTGLAGNWNYALADLPPFTLEIHVTPPLAGIHFSLGGDIFETGEDGVARIEVIQAGTYLLEALPLESATAEFKVEFARWGDYVFTTQRELVISSSTILEAGFHVSYPARFEFIDLEGNPVPAERISMVEIKNSLGDIYTFRGDQTEWLQAWLALSRDIKLDQVEVVNSIQRVVVDGSNVVNRGQQRFVLTQGVIPQVELLLYPAQFTAKDALFGFPTGRGVLLQYPDGHEENFSFDESRTVRIESLARGTYHATVSGAPGIKPQNLFVLSRPQEIQLVVISILDILVGLLLGVILFAGILLAGRPGLRDTLRKSIHKR